MLSALPRWVAAHPVQWGAVAALGIFFVAGPLNGLYVLGFLTAIPFGLLNWWLWRERGPAHRWRAALVERFPPQQR